MQFIKMILIRQIDHTCTSNYNVPNLAHCADCSKGLGAKLGVKIQSNIK